MPTHLTAVYSMVVVRAGGVYWGSGGGDVNDVWVQLILLVQQVKDPNIRPIYVQAEKQVTFREAPIHFSHF